MRAPLLPVGVVLGLLVSGATLVPGRLADPSLACADELDDELVRLDDNALATRQAAERKLLAMVQVGHLPRLVARYATCAPVATYHVVRVVEKLGAPGRPALQQMVRARSDVGAYAAASALQRVGDPSGYAYLIEQVRSPTAPIALRKTMVMYLPSMGTAGPPVLAELAGDAKADVGLRVLALERLANLEPVAGEDRLKASLALPLPPELATAADLYRYARGDLAAAARLEALALAGKLPIVQVYGFLSRIERAKDKDRKAVLVHLGQAGANGSVKMQAMRALAAMGEREEALRIARANVDSPEEILSREAKKLVLESGESGGVEALVAKLAQGTPRDRVEAAGLLLQQDDFRGEAVLHAAIVGADVLAKRAACVAAAALVTRKTPPILARALRDDDEVVRGNAYDSLVKLVRRLMPYRSLDWDKVAYNPSGEPASRTAAADRLDAWLAVVLARE